LLSHPSPQVGNENSISVVDSLRRIRASKGVRNIFKTLDFDTFDIQRVKFLPSTFNGDVLFELPPVDMSGPFHMMHGMDKRHDGHAWTKTVTSNIKSDMSLTFRTSTCIGHLRCENQDCEYTSRIHRTSLVNEREWDGFTVTTIPVGQPAPAGSTLVCKICKVPLICFAICAARIYYVYGAANMTRACLHLGVHEHPIKVGEDQEIKERMRKLIEEQVERTPKATNSVIVMEASKVLVSELLINSDGAPVRKYDLKELVPVLEKCKYMSSPSIFVDLGSWTASPLLEAVATRPTFRRTSSRVKARTQIRCLFSRCPRWGPDPGCTWSIECNPEEIWNKRGSCSITSSVSRIGPPWLATSTTPLIVES
jgi:hypothetical protein